MFKALYIQNFQKHKRIKVEFDPCVTVLTGSSDIGKSAILRALRWLCLNSPQGSAFIKTGTKGTSVKLVLSGEELITRKRTKNENLYKANEKEFKSFGTGVPAEIAELLKVSDLNFQQQHDSPFWLSLSASEVSKQLNTIVDLSVIDNVLASASRRMKSTAKELQVCEKRLKSAKADKESLEWVFEAEQAWQLVQAKHAVKTQSLAYNARLQKTLRNTRTRAAALYNANALVSAGESVVAKVQQAKRQFEKIKKLRSLIKSIKSKQIQEIPDFERLKDFAKTCSENEKKILDLENRIERIIRKKRQIEQSTDIVSLLEKQLLEMKKNQTCPVCGKEMD